MDESEIERIIALALVPVPDRLAEAAAAQLDDATRAQVGAVQRDLATLGLTAGSALPSAELRARVLRSAARPSRRAVLVIDMVCDHLTPGSLLEVPRAREIVPALSRRLDQARAEGTPVVFVLDQHEPDDPDLDDWGTHNVRGSKGAEPWPALAPKPGDRVVTKPSYSGFYRSNLLATLDELKVDSLVLTGCLTEVHVQATAMDAAHHGFNVEVAADSQAGLSAELERAALAVMKLLAPYAPARRERLARLAA